MNAIILLYFGWDASLGIKFRIKLKLNIEEIND